MDKIKINNQVVAMRKFVKQGKTRVINKCVKEIKLLQNRKGNENQVLKCKRKAERLLLEVAIIKKIKPDSVSKMALSKAKDWKAILTRKNVPLEDRCFAILASYEPVQMEVEKFHSSNSYLVSKIATLVEEWEEKVKLTSQSLQKNKKAFKNDSEVSEVYAKKIEMNRNHREIPNIEAKPEIKNAQQHNLQRMIVRKPLEKEESENDTDSNVSDSASEHDEEPMEGNVMFHENDNLNAIDSQKRLKVSKNRSKIIESSLNPSDANSSSSSVEDKINNSSSSELEDEDDSRSPPECFESVNTAMTAQESKLKVESVKNKPNHPKISSVKTNNKINKLPTFQNNFSAVSNSTKAVALLNLNEMLDMDEIPIDNSRTTVETIESCKRKRDTFFLNDNGEDFSESDKDSDHGKQEASHSPFKKKQLNDFYKTESHNERFRNGRNSFKNKRNFGSSPHAQKFGFRENTFNKSNRDFHSKENPNKFGKNQGRQENNFNKNRSNSFEKNEGRQGNQFNRNKNWNTTDKNDRIEQKPFRNSSGKTIEKNLINNKNRNDNYPRNKHESKAGKKEELPLHPSWEAKRKLKGPVKAKFRGKRIVFND